jgi:hypothetical protein
MVSPGISSAVSGVSCGEAERAEHHRPTARSAEIVASYEETRSLAETGRRFGVSRERVRQIVARAGGTDHSEKRQRYPVRFREAVAIIAAREGVSPVAKISGIAVPNLIAWIGEFVGPPCRRGGRPTREEAAARDFRIRAALGPLNGSLSSREAA